MELQCEWEGFAAGLSQLRHYILYIIIIDIIHYICHRSVSTTTSPATTSPTAPTPRFQTLMKTVTKGWEDDYCVYLWDKINVKLFLVWTEASPSAVDLHSDYCRRCDVCRRWEKNHKLCFPKSVSFYQCLPRLCSMLLTRSSSSPADEKGVRCKPYLSHQLFYYLLQLLTFISWYTNLWEGGQM